MLLAIEEVRKLMLYDTCLKEEKMVEVQHSLAEAFIISGLSAYGEMVLPIFSVNHFLELNSIGSLRQWKTWD